MQTFQLKAHKTVEVYTYTDTDHKIWTIEFEDNEFRRTSYDLKSPYSRTDWAKLAEFAGIIEGLCQTKETPFDPDRVMNEPEPSTPEEEEAWRQLEIKNGIPQANTDLEGNA